VRVASVGDQRVPRGVQHRRGEHERERRDGQGRAPRLIAPARRSGWR
jgi:hypothetical protein